MDGFVTKISTKGENATPYMVCTMSNLFEK